LSYARFTLNWPIIMSRLLFARVAK